MLKASDYNFNNDLKQQQQKTQPDGNDFKFIFEKREVDFKLLLWDVDISDKIPWEGKN